jgi:site-specific DNA-adenine methylase
LYRTAISYYGGKGMLVSKYPKPHLRTIVEPFAGGAAYSLKYYQYNIILTDTNRQTCEIWWFLQQKNALEWANRIPESVTAGQTIDDMIDNSWPSGLVYLLRTAANVGRGGINKRHNQITKIAEKNWWRNTIGKIRHWSPKIKHWKITNNDYQSLKNISATWFIDPPYIGPAGRRYYDNNLCYNLLRDWCLSRSGQIIVCESNNAKWLPFEPLTNQKRMAHCNKSAPMELIYHKPYRHA